MSQPGLPTSTIIVLYLSADWPHGSTCTAGKTRRKALICDAAKHVQSHVTQSSVKHAGPLHEQEQWEERVSVQAYAACKQD